MATKQNIPTISHSLPPLPQAGGSYLLVKPFGERLLYVSGCGPNTDAQVYTGRLGEEISADEGYEAARSCIRNLLSAVQDCIGNLGRIKSFVKLTVFVASSQGFYEQSLVANGATDLLRQLFGDDIGLPARSAIGVYSLPHNIPVEVEALVELV